MFKPYDGITKIITHELRNRLLLNDISYHTGQIHISREHSKEQEEASIERVRCDVNIEKTEMTEHDLLVIFDNFEQNDTIQYPVAFIKGSVKCNSCSSVLHGVIRVGNTSEFPVVGGRFKCLQQLKLGINSIEFFYESENHLANQALVIERKPNNCPRNVKLLYIIPSKDKGNFQTNIGLDGSAAAACRKIVVGGMLLQALAAERLWEEGFGRKTFSLHSNSSDEPICEIHESSFTREEFQSMTSQEIWNATAGELLRKQIITESVKVLAFLSCTEYRGTEKGDYLSSLANTKAYVACGRGNLAMIGAAGLYSWASSVDEVLGHLSSQEPVHGSLLDDSGFRGTMGACYATTLGSALHELGHALDLVHADVGIMQRGFEDLDLFFSVVGRPRQLMEKRSGEIKVGIKVKPKESSRISYFNTSRPRCTGNATEGRAFFHRSAAVLLSGHRWLNDDDKDREGHEDSIVITGVEIRAAGAIRLIELHSSDENLIKYWDFTGNPVRVHRFSLNIFDIRKAGDDVSVLVQDYRCNVIRKKIVLPF